jgi:sRNA-binding regulator protein Hfq
VYWPSAVLAFLLHVAWFVFYTQIVCIQGREIERLFPVATRASSILDSHFPHGGLFFMSTHVLVPPFRNPGATEPTLHHGLDAQPLSKNLRSRKSTPAPSPVHFPAQAAVEEGMYRQAELFYLQKQIQSQTPMVIVLEDGERVEGCIEWYDRNCLKVRGKVKALVYKSAIKYMFKLGEQGA